MTEEIHPLHELVKQKAAEIARLQPLLDVLTLKNAQIGNLRNRIEDLIADTERKDALLHDALTAMKYHTNQTRPIENTSERMDAIKEELK